MGLSLKKRSPFDIRKGEYLKALLMFSYIFILIASVLMLKPVRNSLFLSRFGAEKLPYVFMLVALFAAVFSAIGSREKARRTSRHIMTGTLIFSAVCMSAFWAAFTYGFTGGWILYLFYIWVSIFSVVSAAQFWLLANQIYDSREARRLFGFLGTGAVSGGIFGGYLTRMLVSLIKTENLLLVCAGFMIACLLILQVLFKIGASELATHRVRKRAPSVSGENRTVLGQLAASKLLLYVASIIGIGVIVATLAAYQFDAVASEAIKDKDDLTAFFGFWLSNLNILSLLIQVFLTSRVLKSFGVGLSLFFLPAGLLVGSFGMLALPSLWTAIMIKFSDGAFKHSINKSGLELLYMPVPDNIKTRVKSFIDVGIKNIATGIAGILLILLTSIAGLPVRFVSVASLLFICLWLILILRVKKEYVEAFRQAILKRSIDIDNQQINIDDAAVFETFERVLRGSNEKQISYVLDLLSDAKSKRLEPYLSDLLDHDSMEIRLKVLGMALAHESPDLSAKAERLIGCEDTRVSGAAVYYLCSRVDDKVHRLMGLLENSDPRIRCSAMTAAAHLSIDDAGMAKDIDLRVYIVDMLEQIDSAETDKELMLFLKEQLAEFIGATREPDHYIYLERLLEDDNSTIRCAACTSAAAIGATGAIPVLIRQIAHPETRVCAMESLSRFGEAVVDSLADAFEDEQQERAIRLKLPRVIGMIGSQRAVDVLTDKLEGDWDLHLNYELLKGLIDLRIRFKGLRFDRGRYEKCLEIEVKRYHTILSLISLFDDPATMAGINDKAVREGATSQGGRLIQRVLGERRILSLKRIFRLLGLRYPPVDMYNAYLGIISERQALRANALEFLDNVLDSRLKRTIVPIMEHFHSHPASVHLPLPEGYSPPGGDDALCLLLDHEDKWVRISSLYMIGETGYPDCVRKVEEIQKEKDPIVRETAAWCLKRLEESA